MIKIVGVLQMVFLIDRDGVDSENDVEDDGDNHETPGGSSSSFTLVQSCSKLFRSLETSWTFFFVF